MVVGSIKNEDLFNFYECPKRFILMKRTGLLQETMDVSIQSQHLEIAKSFFSEYAYVQADWNEKKTQEAIEKQQNILFPVITGCLKETEFEIKIGGLLWDQGAYKILLPYLSREISERHRATAYLSFFLLKESQIPVSEEILFLGKRKIFKEVLPVSSKPLFIDFLEKQFDNYAEAFPINTKICSSCPFWNQCETVWTEKVFHPIKALSGIALSTHELLFSLGIHTMDDLLKTPITATLSEQVKGIEKLKLKAYSYIHNQVLIAADYVVPREWESTGRNYYFDIEADTYPYLFGFYNEKEYIPFLIKEEKNLNRVSRSLLNFLNKNAENIFHFFEYERKVLEYFLEKHQMRLPMIKLWDVYDILKKNMVLPIQHYSLKMVAKWLGYQWTINLEGQKSIRYFRLWQQKKDFSIIRAILKYNEDDCRATQIVKNWLHRPEEFGIAVVRLTKEEIHEIIVGRN